MSHLPFTCDVNYGWSLMPWIHKLLFIITVFHHNASVTAGRTYLVYNISKILYRNNKSLRQYNYYCLVFLIRVRYSGSFITYVGLQLVTTKTFATVEKLAKGCEGSDYNEMLSAVFLCASSDIFFYVPSMLVFSYSFLQFLYREINNWCIRKYVFTKK